MIKLFEDFNSYSSITLDEYNILLYSDSVIDVTRQTLNLIRLEVSKKTRKYCYSNIFNYTGIGHKYLYLDVTKSQVDILSLKDEWFIIKIKINSGNILYFKCDQMHGLLSVIKNEVDF